MLTRTLVKFARNNQSIKEHKSSKTIQSLIVINSKAHYLVL